MTVTVFFWQPSLPSVGHVSMAIDGNPYISWWPASKQANAAWAQTFKRDIAMEGRMPTWASEPITCLDDEAMRRWWTKVSGRFDAVANTKQGGQYTQPGAGSYSLMFRNCAHLIVEGLKAGGMMKHAEAAAIAAPLEFKTVTPTDVRDMAIALSGELGLWDQARLQMFPPSAARDVRNLAGLDF